MKANWKPTILKKLEPSAENHSNSSIPTAIRKWRLISLAVLLYRTATYMPVLYAYLRSRTHSMCVYVFVYARGTRNT